MHQKQLEARFPNFSWRGFHRRCTKEQAFVRPVLGGGRIISNDYACLSTVESQPRVNVVYMQVIGEGMGDAFLRLRLKDQQKAMDMITSDEQLKGLQLVRAPLVDLEVRGIPALEYFGGVVWQDTIQNFAQGQTRQFASAACSVSSEARNGHQKASKAGSAQLLFPAVVGKHLWVSVSKLLVNRVCL